MNEPRMKPHRRWFQVTLKSSIYATAWMAVGFWAYGASANQWFGRPTLELIASIAPFLALGTLFGRPAIGLLIYFACLDALLIAGDIVDWLGLPTAIMSLTIGLLWIGWQAKVVRERHKAVSKFEARGGRVLVPSLHRVVNSPLGIPPWRRLFGDEPVFAILVPNGMDLSYLESMRTHFPEAKVVGLDPHKLSRVKRTSTAEPKAEQA